MIRKSLKQVHDIWNLKTFYRSSNIYTPVQQKKNATLQIFMFFEF